MRLGRRQHVDVREIDDVEVLPIDELHQRVVLRLDAAKRRALHGCRGVANEQERALERLDVLARLEDVVLDRDLPARPRTLTADSLSNVFGGCNTSGPCRRTDPLHNVCCPTADCNRQSDGTYKCSLSAWM